MRRTIATLALVAAGCAGATAYLPNEPGSTLVDLSSRSSRVAWVEAHPEEPERIRSAILEGVFVEGMEIRHVEVMRNPERAGVSGGGFWRHFSSAGETRYHWYVGGEREPFDDGRGRPVCELIVADGTLTSVRYCPGPGGGEPARVE